MQGDEGAVPGSASRRGDPGSRSALAEVGRLNPEWTPWLRLLERTLAAADDPAWAGLGPEPGPAGAVATGAPLLHGAILAVDPRRARRWVRELLDLAAPHLSPDGVRRARSAARSLDPLELLESAAARDHPRLETLAADARVDPHALAAVAELAVRPLLQACGRGWADRTPRDWPHGYCPICGAWPALVEMRGLDRARHLRCAGCGGDWAWSVLHCAYCGETEHTRLGALVIDGEEETRRVETCMSCRGYTKAITTLVRIPAPSVAVEDLRTVELDLSALDRGYQRPGGPGFSPVVRVVGDRTRAARTPTRAAG